MRSKMLLACFTVPLVGCATSISQELPVLRHHAAPVPAEAVDPLATTPGMERFLDRYVRPYADADTRVGLLALSLGDPAMLGFRYDERLTLTAAEAFEQRRGNCLAYANLVVAMARAAGLRARYQEVRRTSAWAGAEDTVLVPKHVNVVVETRRGAYVLDAARLETNPADQRRRLKDAEALSAYHNNLGADALLAGDLATAYGQLARAIEVAPRRADPWINLGVVLGRNAQFAAAETAYLTALDRDDDAISARSNLYEIYRATGEHARAEEMARQVARYRQRNPYHLLFLAETALEEGRTDQALSLLRRSIELKPEEPRFHAALTRARVQHAE